MRLFKDKNKKDEAKKDLKKVEDGKDIHGDAEEISAPDIVFSGNQSANAHKILRSFYVSEKASLGIAMHQYVFRVSERANKSEVKREVSKLFNVRVRQVKMLNMPKKRRDLGKHPGFKSGFKKAVVVLAEGYVIGQA